MSYLLNNEELGKTIVYQYDESGNLTLVRKYAYSLEKELSNPLEENKYIYSSTWKDQLTKIDSEDITYDIMGRMTKIGSNDLSWNKKGELVSYKGISFTYDLRKLRRTKENSTYYYDSNGHILKEKGTKIISSIK